MTQKSPWMFNNILMFIVSIGIGGGDVPPMSQGDHDNQVMIPAHQTPKDDDPSENKEPSKLDMETKKELKDVTMAPKDKKFEPEVVDNPVLNYLKAKLEPMDRKVDKIVDDLQSMKYEMEKVKKTANDASERAEEAIEQTSKLEGEMEITKEQTTKINNRTKF